MSGKTDAQVIIGGKVLTLCGYESEEYLQKVASYINNKISEYNRIDSYTRQPQDMQAVLMELNIADDYFKARKQIDALEADIETKDKEIYDLKHDLIASQMRYDTLDKSNRELKKSYDDMSKEVVRLETELKDARKA